MAVDRYLNSTDYEHPQESNLLNVHKAMEYNAIGQPVLRANVNLVGLGEGSGVSSSIDSNDEGLDVEFGACMIYNRAITYEENLQNFNQFKTRYGL